MEHAIVIQDVTKRFRETVAVSHVTACFETGKIHGIIGRNGSGKTVLFKCICGLFPVTEGSIEVLGQRMGDGKRVPKGVGAIIETPGFLPNCSGYQNLRYLMELSGKVDRERIRWAIATVGLDPDSKKHVGKYSLGMRQRLAEGCVQAGSALIGGETAEMPGFYPVDEYDLAGFSVGIVDKKKIVDHSAMVPGDVVIALPSSGVHSNGFSLVRKVFDVEHTDIQSPCEALGGASIGETLLTPTKIYVKPMLALFDQVRVKGVSHITGGGFYENIPRAIPDGLGAKIQKSAIRILPIFDLIAKTGHIPERDMFNTFNMGVGMSVVVAKEDAETALSVLQTNGEDAYLIGEIVASQDKVILE